MIETLSAEGVTSLFIGVEESGQPPEQYGLLSMADALISFEQRELGAADYLGHLDACLGCQDTMDAADLEDVRRRLGRSRRTVALRVVRFAGGREAGAGGLLELVGSYRRDDEEGADPRLDLYGAEGLQFVPFSPDYSQGSVVRRDRPTEAAAHLTAETTAPHPTGGTHEVITARTITP